MSEGRNLSSAPFAYVENELKKNGSFLQRLTLRIIFKF